MSSVGIAFSPVFFLSSSASTTRPSAKDEFFLLFNKFFDCKDSPNRSKISLPVLFCPALTSKILNPNSLATARIVAVLPLPESPKTINPLAMFAPEPSPKPSFFSPPS